MEEQKADQRRELLGYPFLAKFWSKSRTGMAELVELEAKLKQERQNDCMSGEGRRVDCDWNWSLLSSPHLNRGSKQWEIMLQLRHKLAEYHSALVSYSQVMKLPCPCDRQRKDVFAILGSSSLTNGGLGRFQSRDLGGLDGPEVYGQDHLDDLVLLEGAEEGNDALSRWFTSPLFELCHFVRRGRKKMMTLDVETGSNQESVLGIHHYSRQEKMIQHVFNTLIATAMPLGSMVILYFVNSKRIKLGLVCVFSLIFCLMMSICSNARRIEIFAATAALYGSVNKTEQRKEKEGAARFGNGVKATRQEESNVR